MRPAIEHLFTVNNTEGCNSGNGGDGSGSMSAMITCRLSGEFAMAFLVGLVEVDFEIIKSPIVFIDFTPAFSGSDEHARLFKDFER